MIKSTDLRPTEDRVLIKENVTSDVTAGGIVTLASVNPKEHKGEVIAVGPKVELVSPGDVVYHERYAGDPVECSDEGEFYLMKEDRIIAIEE